MIKNNKSGFTLVEVIVSTVILGTVIVACVLAINSSTKMISKTGIYESHIANVQKVCDTLIEELHTIGDADIGLQIIWDATNVTNEGFNFTKQLDTQYTITSINNGLGFHIKVRMYITSSDDYVEMTAYSDKNGGVWD